MLGHAQAAAGALELCATILAMERGRLPQTLHFTHPRRHAPTDPVPSAEPRASGYRYAVSTNSAFGGANAALVVAAPEVAPRREPVAARPVFIAGVAALGSHGASALALARHLDDREALARGALSDAALDGVAWPADPHRLDPSTRYLLGAVTLALGDAGLRRLTGSLADRSGCFAGITRVSPCSIDEIRRSIRERGLARLSATAFSRLVLNAPLGSCARLLALRGATSTVSIGAGSGLFALVYAARWLATRQDTLLMLGAGLDELPLSPEAGGGSRNHARAGADGAACVVLSPVAAPGRPRLAGYAIGGPGSFQSTAERALASAGVDELDVCIGPAEAAASARRHVDPAPVFGDSQSFASAASVVVAASWLRAGRARHALVCAGGASATVAAVFSAAPEAPSPRATEEDACTANPQTTKR
jgi:3-oxoacyl-[acyl-carrier-protein] synthase II